MLKQFKRRISNVHCGERRRASEHHEQCGLEERSSRTVENRESGKVHRFAWSSGDNVEERHGSQLSVNWAAEWQKSAKQKSQKEDVVTLKAARKKNSEKTCRACLGKWNTQAASYPKARKSRQGSTLSEKAARQEAVTRVRSIWWESVGEADLNSNHEHKESQIQVQQSCKVLHW